MASFYDSLEGLFSQEMTKKIATVLEEKNTDISKASSQIIASLLGIMAKKGHTSRIRNIFEEAGNIGLITDIGMFDEHLTHPQQEIGDNFLQQLLGDKAEAFTLPISKESGVSAVAINRLVSVIGSSFPAFFGKKIVKDGISFQSIIDETRSQEKSYASKIPADIVKTFGLGSILTPKTGNTHHEAAGTTTTQTSTATKPSQTPTPEPEKSKNSWIKWLFIILAILLFFFWWRSCNSSNDYMARNTYMADSVNVIAEANPMVANEPAEAAEILAITEITLPNGENIQTYKDGIEEQMVNFLSSDEYKNATDKDLQGKWFEFDNIDFEFGSTTQLREGSKPQLDNIITILKAHKDVKVMVAAFADKKGTETANMKVSKERAKNIERMMEEGGVGSQVVKTEGYGETQAKYSANAPDSLRAKDRDIALRFVK